MNLIAAQGQAAGSLCCRVVIREVGPGVDYHPYRRGMECPDIECGPSLVLRQFSAWHAIYFRGVVQLLSHVR